ncbi:MAG TPA: hypothetical protein VJX92_21145 [Methylomirabilota bacterium]|nr:hypothetical protein [Methylomirabilota bacterium]
MAQTPAPATPSGQPAQSESQQQQQQSAPPPGSPQPAEAPPPTVEQQLQQLYQFQPPGRPPASPATPPSTTIPPWTPPVAPAPSQTNVPVPFPFAGQGAVGRAPGAIPGAFAPTITTIRGATLEFHPTARAGLQYSDNFFQTTTKTEENFRTTLGPGFTLLLNGARTYGVMALNVDLIHDTAKDSGDELKVFPSLNASVRYALSPRLGITLSEAFVRDDAASTADQFGIRRGRQTFDTNTAGLALDWLLDRIALQAYYRNVLFINEDNNSSGNRGSVSGSQQDSITNVLGVNASTRIAVDYLLRLGYEFSRNDSLGNTSGTSNSQIENDNTTHTVFGQASRQFGLYTTGGVSSSYSIQSQDSTTIWNASIFGAYGLPSGLSLSGSVGYSILNSDTEDNTGTVSARLSASYRFARALVSVGAFRDFRQTAQQGQNFGTVETSSYFGTFLYQLTPFINVTLQADYTENEPTGTGNTANTGTQKQLTYGASLNWQLLRWLAMSLQYSHIRNTGVGTFNQGTTGGVSTGGVGNNDYKENRASITFFATF